MTIEAALKYSGVAFLFGVLTYIAEIAPQIATGSSVGWDHPAHLIVAILVAAGTAGLIKALPWLAIVLKNAPAQPSVPLSIGGMPTANSVALASASFTASTTPPESINTPPPASAP